MAILEILRSPDPRLKKVAKPIEKIDDTIKKLSKDMLETMYKNNGIGLAATQIGVEKRIVVMDVTQGENKNEPLILINPQVIRQSDELKLYNEGCLSFPTQYAEVERPDKITAEYLDLQGKKQQIEADGLLSVCIQHEIDHLNGKVFVDYLSRLKREKILKRLVKMNKLGYSYSDN